MNGELIIICQFIPNIYAECLWKWCGEVKLAAPTEKFASSQNRQMEHETVDMFTMVYNAHIHPARWSPPIPPTSTAAICSTPAGALTRPAAASTGRCATSAALEETPLGLGCRPSCPSPPCAASEFPPKIQCQRTRKLQLGNEVS
jgi:hypothetical protein